MSFVHLSRLLRSSTFRLAQVYMALFGASVLVLLGFLYWATAGYMLRQNDETIEAEIIGLAEQYRTRGVPGLTSVIADRIQRDPAGSSIYLLTGPDFAPIVGNLVRWPPMAATIAGWIEFPIELASGGANEQHRGRARSFLLQGNLHLLVGRDIHDLDRTRQLIIHALGWGIAIMAGLALFGGLMMSRSIMRRIDAINQTARQIVTGDLSRRVPTRGTGDDFDRLADHLNAMLSQIETLMDGVRHVSDSIAHDLRTPLTRLRNKLERAAAVPEGPARQLSIQEATDEADRLLATFSALLRIGEIESGSRRAGFAEVDLAAIVRDVAELYEPVAQERGQVLDVAAETAAPVVGDRDLLFQAFANLLDNATKYTAERGTVRVAVEPIPDGWRVVVADTGPGIPIEMRPRVFERFYRLEASRATPGNGLGLSFVAAVAKLHEANITMDDCGPGLKIAVGFPAAARAVAPSRDERKPIGLPSPA